MTTPAQEPRPAADGEAQVRFEAPAEWMLLARVHGDLDLLTVPPLRAALERRLRASRPCRLVLDLSRVTLLSSAGLAWLVALGRLARTLQVHVVLVGAAHRAVHQPLRLTGLLALFDVRASVGRPASVTGPYPQPHRRLTPSGSHPHRTQEMQR